MNKLSTSAGEWTLTQELKGEVAVPVVIGLSRKPQTVGRTKDSNVMVDSLVVSKVHALVGLDENDDPYVQDLKSTNGTFINNERKNKASLQEGDLVRFANLEFKVSGPSAAGDGQPTCNWAEALLRFEELMWPGGVKTYCQPIIRLADRQPIGYECLARSELKDLELPGAMFAAARELNHESELSLQMRRASVEALSKQQHDPGIVFVNAHPAEGFAPQLEQSLRELRQAAPTLDLAVELKETMVNDTGRVREFRELLHEINIKLVYDDFGTDQDRLNHLVQVPPDYLKFDVSVIRKIDEATPYQRSLVQALVNAVHGLGIVSVAEGVERENEAQVCAELGFQLAQGFLFAEPAPISTAKSIGSSAVESVR